MRPYWTTRTCVIHRCARHCTSLLVDWRMSTPVGPSRRRIVSSCLRRARSSELSICNRALGCDLRLGCLTARSRRMFLLPACRRPRPGHVAGLQCGLRRAELSQSATGRSAGEQASQSASRFAYDAPIDAALEAAGSTSGASALDPLGGSLGSLADPLALHSSEAGSRGHSRGGSLSGGPGATATGVRGFL